MSYGGNFPSISTEGFKQTRNPELDVVYTTNHPIPSAASDYSPLELVINGPGFFQIQKADGGMAYTRNGSLSINSQGVVVTSSGLELYPRISMPSNRQSVTVASNGEVSVVVEGSNSATHTGNIELSKFVNPEGLERIGTNLYGATNASGSPETGTPGVNGFGSIVQATSTDSSISVAARIAAELAAQRQHEMSSISTSMGDLATSGPKIG